MKIFGIEFGTPKAPVKVIADETPEIDVPMRTDKPISQMPFVLSPALTYSAARQTGRGQFICSEYDLAEVGRVEDTESFVRQAFDKKVALMFKEGYDIIGRNPRTVKYVKIRLAQIQRASETPTVKLLRDVGSSLIRKSNAFLVKVRNTDASGGRLRTLPNSEQELKPVAAYFPAPAETMEVSYSGNKVAKWRQKMPDGNIKEYQPRDIIHIYYDKKDGFTFGTPQLVPVLDDIRALRKIEENIELLIYQHLFPLFQYKVGTEERPAGIDENGEREIDVVRREIQYMPAEGGIVTTDRHEITAIGVEGRAMHAEGYLEHFKKRVIAGLGVSAVDLGDGNTTNRATSDNMSRNLIDSVKDFQQVLEYFFNEAVIAELLLESTFGDDVLDDDNRVWLKFKEIDIDAQIKKEAHMADQFNKNLVTHDEARLRVGLEPIKMPSSEEAQSDEDLTQKFPEFHKLFWKMIDEPKALIQSIDEPYSLAAKAAAKNPSTGVNTPDQEASAEEAKEHEVEMEKVKGKAKIAIAKMKPKPKVRDAFVTNRYDEVEQEVLSYYETKEKIDHDWIAQLVRTSMAPTVDYLIANQVTAFRSGYNRHGDTRDEAFLNAVANARISFRDRAEKYIHRLVRDLNSSLKRNVPRTAEIAEISKAEVSNLVKAVFDTLRYRADFIESVEIDKARMLGISLAIRNSGRRHVFVQGHGGGCDRCKDQMELDTFTMVLDDVPPFHANCRCKIVLDKDTKAVEDANQQDPMVEMEKNGSVAECPKCGKTAMRVDGSVATFRCRACSNVFEVKKDD